MKKLNTTNEAKGFKLNHVTALRRFRTDPGHSQTIDEDRLGLLPEVHITSFRRLLWWATTLEDEYDGLPDLEDYNDFLDMKDKYDMIPVDMKVGVKQNRNMWWSKYEYRKFLKDQKGKEIFHKKNLKMGIILNVENTSDNDGGDVTSCGIIR